MATSVRPVTGLTKWLVFWLKAYVCVIAISMLADVGSHFFPDEFAGSHIPNDAVLPMLAHAHAAQQEDLETKEDDDFAAAGMDDLADDDSPFGLGLTLWDTIDLAASLMVGFAFMGLYLLTGLLFFMWVYRMAGNLHVLRQGEFPYTPLWSVGCFFIPFVNIVAPPRIMQKFWSTVSGSTEKSLVSGWWAIVIVQYVLDQAEARMLTTAWRREQGVQFAFSNAEFFLGLGTSLMNAVVAVFTLLLVQRITREYIRHVAGGPAEAMG